MIDSLPSFEFGKKPKYSWPDEARSPSTGRNTSLSDASSSCVRKIAGSYAYISGQAIGLSKEVVERCSSFSCGNRCRTNWQSV